MDKLEILLIEEINIIKQYLLIEKNRFEERLEYSIDVSKKTEKLKILAFLIQPFVENAIKYGMKTNSGVMKLNLNSYIEDDCLCIEINNTGRWVQNNDENGIGIHNVKERLKNAYPGKHELSIKTEDGWIMILITIEMTALDNLEVVEHEV